MAEKKVVGLDNLKIFYNKLKDIFVPKLEGKNYLTSDLGSEGYTQTEVDTIAKQLEEKIHTGGTIDPGSIDFTNVNWEAWFNNIEPVSLNDIEANGDITKYNYFYQTENGYQAATIQYFASIVNKDEKMFFLHPLLSHGYPGFSTRMYVNEQITNAKQNLNYLGYNYGQTTGFNYPDYFSYYIMNIDDETKELSYLPISKTEAKTRGESGEYIFVKAYTPTDIESLINKKIKTFKTSSELQNIIDQRIKALVKTDSLNNG